MKGFALLVKGMVLNTVRDPQTLFWNLAFPVFWLLIYKLVFGRFLESVPNGGGWLLSGLIVLNLLAFGLITSSTQMVDMRDKGVLRRLKATPLPAWQLFLAYLVNNVLVCAAQIGILIVAGIVLVDAKLSVSGLLSATPLILAGIVTFTALGQVISSVAQKIGAAVAIVQILYFGQMFISNLIMPLEQMPKLVQQIAAVLPAYLLGDLVRSPLLGNGWSANSGADLALLGAYAVAAALLSARFFRWEPRA